MADIIKERTNQFATQGKQAVASGVYVYPIRGIAYFLSHRALQKPLYRVALPSILLSLGVLIAVFSFLYLPQVAALAIVNGPVAFVNAALLCLSETTTLVNVISRAFLLEDALLEVFDATLLERGLQSLVSQGRELKTNKHDSFAKLGKLVTRPLQRFSPRAILEYLILLPLNAIPIVGTATFIIIQGAKNGPHAHTRYFDLKKFSPEQREKTLKDRKGSYTAFGTAAALLGLIPFASIPLQFTNTVGAALWAADAEQANDSLMRDGQGKKAQ